MLESVRVGGAEDDMMDERRRLLVAVLGLVACFPASVLSAEPKPASKVTFDDHMLPILRQNCLSCHNPDRKRGGLRLDTFAGIMAGGGSGEVIKPGDPEGSVLFKVVSHQQEPFMPPSSPALQKESLDTIRRWIAGGALETAGSVAKTTSGPKVDFSLAAAAKGKPAGAPPMPPPTLSLEPVAASTRANAVTALAASPWAALVAVGGQHQVTLYQSDTLDCLGVLPFPEGVPCVLRFSRNGALLLAGGGRAGKSGRVVVWDVRTGKRLFEVGGEYDAVLAADISADQSQVALGGPGKVVRLYSTHDGKLLHEIHKHTDWVESLEYSPDGVLLASGDRNGGLFVWEAHTAREYFTLRGHTAAITGLSWRADSNLLCSASEDGTVRLWEMENGGQVKACGAHGGGAASVCCARDGRIVSCGRDHLVRMWDAAGNAQRAFEPLPDVALRAVFTHDGARVIAGDWSGLVRVWTASDGKIAGAILANPPTLAERLEAAGRELAALKVEKERQAVAALTSRTVAAHAIAQLTDAEKAAAARSSAAQSAAASIAKAREAVDQAVAGLRTAQSRVQARDVLTASLAEAALKVAGAASRDKANKEMAEAAERARQLASQSAAELAEAHRAVVALAVAGKVASERLAALQQANQNAPADATVAQKRLAALTAAAKAATEKAARDQAAADAAAATWQAKVERWSTALEQTKQPAKTEGRKK